ncbi:kinase-like domain-containing protein [Rhizoctonia solani]|nr:kinase-like domain-containing protein [Rhizoctonia solani]
MSGDSNMPVVTASPKIYCTTPSLISLDTRNYITSEPSTIPNELVPDVDPQSLFMPSISCTEGAHTPNANKPNPKRQNTLAALARDAFKRKRRKTLATLTPAPPSSVFYSDIESVANVERCHELKSNDATASSAHAKQGEIVGFWRKITRRWSEGDAHMRGKPTLGSTILRIASIVKEKELKEAKTAKGMKKTKEGAAGRNEDEERHVMEQNKEEERREKEEEKQDKKEQGVSLTSEDLAASRLVSELVAHGCEDLSERINLETFSGTPVACGGLSDIYRGQLFDGRLVAVKAWRISAQQTISESTEQIRHAARELYTWSKCSHPNVLRLLGLATFRNRIGMVSPWMKNGTLTQYVRANPNANRHNLCVRICEGLSYLHTTGIVHGDLKGANILISDDGTPVLADFGSSTMKDQTLKITVQGGNHSLTVRWSAPELLEGKYAGRHTKYSDVYALGMTIYEIITGNVPYHLEGLEVRVMALLLKGALPIRPVCTPMTHESSDKLWNLFVLCWKYTPEGRPSATEVTEMTYRARPDIQAHRSATSPPPMSKPRSIPDTHRPEPTEEQYWPSACGTFDVSAQRGREEAILVICMVIGRVASIRIKGKEKTGVLPSQPEQYDSNMANSIEPVFSSPLLPQIAEPESYYHKPRVEIVEGEPSAIPQPPTPLPPIPVPQATSTEIPQVYVNDRNTPPISRETPAREVVSQLVEHGCEDLSERIDISTFGDHPFTIGGLSDIYRGCLTDRKPVAVKALRIAMQHSIGESPKHLRRAARELHTWSKCKHPNVLPLYGLVTFRDRIGMVSPWMSKGTLPQYLSANPSADRRRLSIQICEGLSYIHEAGIIHGDLKGENVLVDDDNNAVLAILAYTVRWSAPELVIANGCQHTKDSDVFALGMTIYEVLTGKVPYHEIKELAPVMLRIIQRDTPTRPVSIPDGHESGDMLWDLFTLCWKYVPDERPSAANVTEVMKGIPLDGVVYRVPQTTDSVRESLAGGENEAANPPDTRPF